MSVLAYVESSKGKVKKNAFEIVSYSSELAKKLDTDLVTLVLNCDDTSELGKYGASKILKVTSSELENFSAKSYANIIAQAEFLRAYYYFAQLILATSLTPPVQATYKIW